MRRIISVLLMLTVPVLLYSQKECSQLTSAKESSDKIIIPFSSGSGLVSPLVPGATIKVPNEIVIPVVVHLVNGDRLGITDAQVHSQIAALNRDFNGMNSDLVNVPSYFAPLVGNASIRFELAKVDPAGKPSSGIRRTQSSIQHFSMDDRIKFNDKGGDNAWPRDHYLNIWVSSMLNGIQGYSSLPGASAEVDGIVLNHSVFGTIGKLDQYGMGRVAVHEVGHWLGLMHIWGDEYCGNDGVDDTPPQKSYNKGYPTGIINSCGNDPNGDMYMNFMDLTDDACMKMFTKGQVSKMRASFEVGGPRNALLVSGAFKADGIAIDPNWNESARVNSLADILRVYPNPAQTEIKVELDPVSAGYTRTLWVYNLVGQLITTVPVNGRIISVNISGLQTGQYIIKTDKPYSRAVKMVKL